MGKPCFDLLPFALQVFNQAVESERNAVQGVAKNHALKRDQVLRCVPGIGTDDPGQGQAGDQGRGRQHTQHAVEVDPGEAPARALHGADSGNGRHHQAHREDQTGIVLLEQPLQQMAHQQELHDGAR